MYYLVRGELIKETLTTTSYKESADKLLGLHDKLKARDEEAFQLQQSLGDAQISLYEERENYLKLITENEQLKVQYSVLEYRMSDSLEISMRLRCR